MWGCGGVKNGSPMRPESEVADSSSEGGFSPRRLAMLSRRWRRGGEAVEAWCSVVSLGGRGTDSEAEVRVHEWQPHHKFSPSSAK